MPITPFHFGPGAVLNAIAPKHISFVSFVAANVLIDIEPFYYMSTQQYPLHRFFHTYVGAGFVSIAAVLLVIFCAVASKKLIPTAFERFFASSLGATASGAILGSYSHIVLDSIMHSDIRPLAPFSQANSLLGAISLSSLHWLCIYSGIFGISLLALRYMLKSKATR